MNNHDSVYLLLSILNECSSLPVGQCVNLMISTHYRDVYLTETKAAKSYRPSPQFPRKKIRFDSFLTGLMYRTEYNDVFVLLRCYFHDRSTRGLKRIEIPILRRTSGIQICPPCTVGNERSLLVRSTRRCPPRSRPATTRRPPYHLPLNRFLSAFI